jgi:acetyl-CoA synthetase
MHIDSKKELLAAIENSKKPEFWLEIAKQYKWKTAPTKALEGSFTDLPVRWFSDGVLNITENCLDRHLPKKANDVAIVFEHNNPQQKEKTKTYKELHEDVCRFANVLKTFSVGKGDVVCFYMPMGIELLTGVLACARIGAVHSVVFGGFSATALRERILDCQAKVVVTNNEGLRGSKTIPLKTIVDDAVRECSCVQTVLVNKHTSAPIDWMKRDQDLKVHIAKASAECPPVYMQAEDPLFILYTSGSTGKPKGLVHTVGGYMLWVGETFKNIFQYNEKDIFWCTADIGWITGHSYVAYGPLLNGAQQVIYEGVPNYPDAGRFWEIIDKHKVTHFYTAPTAIRALLAEDISFVRKYKLDSLKVLGSVGEPINQEAWQWYHSEIGKNRCPIVDTWWQTETGGIMISTLAGITPSVATVATQPFPGVFPELLTPDGRLISEAEAEGVLCIRQPWPGIARTIHKDSERYKQTYFSAYPGFYFTGDGAKRFANGDYRIVGRIDDVVNVSGHRIGTAEVEDIINQHDAIVIGVPHSVKGQCIVAFVICVQKISDEILLKEVNAMITERIGPIAKLEHLFVVSGLPKTRSGKIMRRVLRKSYENDRKNVGDVSTLVNPEIVDEIFKKLSHIHGKSDF